MSTDVQARLVIKGDGKGAQEEMKKVKGSLGELEGQSKRLMAEFRNLAKGTKEFADKAKELRDVNARIKDIKDSISSLHEKSRLTAMATQALGTSLGFLGASSVSAVVGKMIEFGRESIRLAISLEAMQNRAEAVFGTAFPQAQREIEALGQKVGRSASDLLEYRTGFANLMDSLGVSGPAMQGYSQDLTELTVALGRAFPDKSDAEVYSILEAGILGNTRGLRQLGIAMKDDQLQRFATMQQIPVLVKDMDEEQKMRLRIMYLLEETTNLQDAAAESARDGLDAGKELAATWQDFSETIGQVALPVLNFFLGTMSGGIKDAIALAQALKATLLDAASFGAYSNYTGQMKALEVKQRDVDANLCFQQEHGIGLGAARKSLMPEEYAKAEDPWAKRPGVGGGGGTAEKTAEQLLREREQAEQKILSAFGEQAKATLQQLTSRREELKLRERLGALTDKENRELQRINTRVSFKKDLVEETTEAWEKQAEAIKKAGEKIEDNKKKIIDEHRELQKALKQLDRDTNQRIGDLTIDANRDLVGVARDLIREQGELNDQLARGEGLSEKEQRRMKEIEATLALQGSTLLEEGERYANMDPFEEVHNKQALAIDDELRARERRIREAAEESDARVGELQETLNAEQQKLDALKAAEQEKKNAVITAMNDRLAAVQSSYALELEATRKHVSETIAEFNRLPVGNRAVKGVQPAIPALAQGGIVTRPTLALIGESGPEAVVPLRKGAGAAGGVSVTITNMHVYKEADADEVVRRITRQIQLQGLGAS